MQEGSDKRDDGVLQFYSDIWKYFTFSSQVIHNLFLYLNRHWVRREMEDGNKKIFEIYSVSDFQCIIYCFLYFTLLLLVLLLLLLIVLINIIIINYCYLLLSLWLLVLLLLLLLSLLFLLWYSLYFGYRTIIATITKDVFTITFKKSVKKH